MSTFSSVYALTQLHIDTTCPSPATARVAVSGEVDLATAQVLRDRLLGVLRDEAPTMLSVDLAGVTFLDCTGIDALIAARNAAARTGRQIRVTHPQPIVRRVLDLTGLLDVFTAPIEQSQPVAGDLNARPGTGPRGYAVVEAPQVLQLLPLGRSHGVGATTEYNAEYRAKNGLAPFPGRGELPDVMAAA